MRQGLAIVLAGIALAGAVYVGSVKLKAHGHFHCDTAGGSSVICIPGTGHWTPARATWQLPVAIVIAAVGIGVAVVVARGGN